MYQCCLNSRGSRIFLSLPDDARIMDLGYFYDRAYVSLQETNRNSMGIDRWFRDALRGRSRTAEFRQTGNSLYG